MPTEDAYSSGHLVLSHFGTCMCSNVDTNLSWTCLVSGPLNFEHPSVLLFCFILPFIRNVTISISLSHILLFLNRNIRAVPAYGVFISQLIRYARACFSYECFTLRATLFQIICSNMDTSRNAWNRFWRSFWSIRGSYQTIQSSPLTNA